MLDMGFEPQIMKIILDIRPDRQTIMTRSEASHQFLVFSMTSILLSKEMYFFFKQGYPQWDSSLGRPFSVLIFFNNHRYFIHFKVTLVIHFGFKILLWSDLWTIYVTALNINCLTLLHKSSATWPTGVRRLARSYLKDPMMVYVGTLDLAVSEHLFCFTPELRQLHSYFQENTSS